MRLAYKLVVILVVFWVTALLGLIAWNYIRDSLQDTTDVDSSEPSAIAHCAEETGVAGDLMMRNISNPAVADCLTAQCETSEETCQTLILDIATSPVKDLPGVQLFLDSVKSLIE